MLYVLFKYTHAGTCVTLSYLDMLYSCYIVFRPAGLMLVTLSYLVILVLKLCCHIFRHAGLVLHCHINTCGSRVTLSYLDMLVLCYVVVFRHAGLVLHCHI